MPVEGSIHNLQAVRLIIVSALVLYLGVEFLEYGLFSSAGSCSSIFKVILFSSYFWTTVLTFYASFRSCSIMSPVAEIYISLVV